MNPDLMRFDLLYKRPPEPEPAPPLKELRRPVLRFDNPAYNALREACKLLKHNPHQIIECVTAYRRLTEDGFAFDLDMSQMLDTFATARSAMGLDPEPGAIVRWFVTIDYTDASIKNKRCARVEVVNRG